MIQKATKTLRLKNKCQHQCCSEHCFNSEKIMLTLFTGFQLLPCGADQAAGVLQQYFYLIDIA